MRPAASYVDLLARLAKKYGITAKDVKVSRMSHSRFFGDNKAPSRTLTMANRYARVLREKEGIEMPPSWVPVIDPTDYEWIELGRQLREANAEKFSEMLDVMRLLAPNARDALRVLEKLDRIVSSATNKTPK